MSEKTVIYVNVANIAMSTNDFEISVGLKKDRSPGTPVAPDDIDIVLLMSPQHAKSFAIAVGKAVQIYEEMYGNISIQADPEIQKKYTSEIKMEDLM